MTSPFLFFKTRLEEGLSAQPLELHKKGNKNQLMERGRGLCVSFLFVTACLRKRAELGVVALMKGGGGRGDY